MNTTINSQTFLMDNFLYYSSPTNVFTIFLRNQEECHLYTVCFNHVLLQLCHSYIIIYSSDRSRSKPGCPDYTVSSCQTCYYSSTPLLYEGSLCTEYCVNNDGEYDLECLEKWGRCLREELKSTFRSVRYNIIHITIDCL